MVLAIYKLSETLCDISGMLATAFPGGFCRNQMHVTLKRLERYDTMRGARSMPVSDIMRLVAGCLHQAHHAQSFVQCLPGHSQQVLTNLETVAASSANSTRT